MKHFVLAIFIAFTSLSLQSCSGCKHTDKPIPDNPYGLPNATQTGANIFACRINGKNFIAQNISYYTIGGWMSLNKDTFRTEGMFGNSKYFMYLYLGDSRKDRIINQHYSFQDTVNTYFVYYTDSTCLGISSQIVTINEAIGYLTYSKIDTTNQIVSGTFSCRVAMPNCDTLNITDGRFDIKYHY